MKSIDRGSCAGVGERLRGSLRMAGLMAAVALAMVIAAAPAQAEFGVKTFDGQITANQAGDPYTQAGGHPFDAWSAVGFNSHPDPALFGLEIPDADARTVTVDLPPGLVGNPTAAPQCSRVDFFSPFPGDSEGTNCPMESQVGYTFIDVFEGNRILSAVWNLAPSPQSPASFGFQVGGVRVIANASVRTGEDYGITLTFPNINQGLQILQTQFVFWGTPADSRHDTLRCNVPYGFVVPPACFLGEPGDYYEGPNSVKNSNPVPFVTLPTACTPAGVGLETRLAADSWQNPGAFVNDSFVSHLPPAFPAPEETWGPPQGPTGCEKLPFEPEINVAPTSSEAGAPTGLEVTLTVPQDGLRDPGALATAHLKRATVTLPPGMTLNSATANGLNGCTPSQIDLKGPGAAACPASSKIGTVAIDTPLLDRDLEGGIYLATQGANPFNSLVALYLAAEDEASGVTIKLAGRVTPDPSTGQLVTTFDDNPQLPFETMRLRFNDGDRAALVNPPTCGTHAAQAAFTSWAQPHSAVGLESTFSITGDCGRSAGFSPNLDAGVTNPVAGESSPFTLRVTRPDGQQNLSSLAATLPEGLLAKLAGVAVCPDAQAATASCPAGSQVGTVTVATGAGASPVFVPQAGKEPTGLYLAGPYKGAPISLVAKVPAQAGPFDLGTVAVRNALRVDPVSAQVTAVSDPLPQILQGIPISYRDVRVDVTRPGFTVNPTSCEPMRVEGLLTSAAGATAADSDRFQVTDCASLSFRPKLALRLSGKTHRSAHPALKAILTMPKQGANIGKAVVTLPKTQFLAQGHIRTICTRVQYAADSCPKASVYGYAKAWTPLLDKPLQGPVYLRSSTNTLPDLVADLNGQIEIDLAGRIDSVNSRMRTTFWAVPDAPVSRFVLRMQGGKKGLLVNNTELCEAKPRASAAFTGQNGKRSVSNPLVKVDCGRQPKSR